MTKEGGLFHSPLTFIQALAISLVHPDRISTTRLFGVYCDVAQELASRSPWELHSENGSYQDELAWTLTDIAYMERSFRRISRVIELAWRARIYLRAVETCLALHRYQTQSESFPQSLRELVDQGYLDQLPRDIYSNSALVYRAYDDRFVLYSVGTDLEDNGGTESNWGEDDLGGDEGFWPVDAKPIIDDTVPGEDSSSSILSPAAS